MSFPITHLRVADIVTQKLSLSDEQTALLLLGSLAPDGVHYRPGLVGASKFEIGETKKISHLCPKSDEPWGQITDNIGWMAEVDRLCPNHLPDFLVLGYTVHVLTDIYNNMTIWKDFSTLHPGEAVKGYKNDYTRDMAALDLQLYQEPETGRIIKLLPLAEARDFPGWVSATEIDAIRNSILYEGNSTYTSYVNRPAADTSGNRFVTYAQIKGFITEATAFALKHLPVLQ
jgi:hypothetical protein